MQWKQAGKIFLWQLAASLLVAAAGYIAAAYFQFELPSAMAAIAMMIGAQSFAVMAESKVPSSVVGKVWSLAWRVGLLDALFGLSFGYLYLYYTASLVPEFAAILEQVNQSPLMGAVVVASTVLISFGTTALGLRMGGRMGAKVYLARHSAGS